MDVARMLTWTAERYPHHCAVGGATPMTYRERDARTNRLARALAGLGVRPRDRVALLLAGGEPMASLHLAVQKAYAMLRSSRDFAEGVKAFTEKRAPQFEGR